MITPSDFWLAVHRLAEAYSDQGLSLWDRQDSVLSEFDRLPDVARRSLLVDFGILNRNLPDLYVALIGQENARRERERKPVNGEQVA